MSTPTDTELLNWLDGFDPGDDWQWVCRPNGRGIVVFQTTFHAVDAAEGFAASADIRQAIAAAMEKQRKEDHG